MSQIHGTMSSVRRTVHAIGVQPVTLCLMQVLTDMKTLNGRVLPGKPQEKR